MLFARKDPENDVISLKNRIIDLEKKFFDIENDFKTAKLKYTAMIEELTAQNKILNDKILKKAQYLEQKEQKFDMKEAIKMKYARQMGLIPQNLNRSDTYIPQNETKA